jgi:glycosyltransferase involved in cell wall biosynthesis
MVGSGRYGDQGPYIHYTNRILISMRLAFIADGRSSHTIRWLHYFAKQGHQVHLLTTYPCCKDDFPGITLHNVHLWLHTPDTSKVKGPLGNTKSSNLRQKVARLLRSLGLDEFIRPVWERLIVFEIWRLASAVCDILSSLRPDLVHALRLPIEGYVAALANCHPLILSSWGCDFTYWRPMNRLYRNLTDRALRIADGFIADCERDLRFAMHCGFKDIEHTMICPTNGGVRHDILNLESKGNFVQAYEINNSEKIVLYSRGIGGPYYRFETFAGAISLVLEKISNVVFVILGGANNLYAQRLIHRYGVDAHVRLLPYMPHGDVLQVLKESHVMVSPSTHDGTPNSMLEAMACGCFPIMSDLESTREWINAGVNGLLFAPQDAMALSRQIVYALQNEELRQSAAEINRSLVQQRADYFTCMSRVESLYEKLIPRR